MIIFGGGQDNGYAYGTLFNDTWVLTNANGQGGTPTWIPLNPVGGPPAGRTDHRAFYDNANNRMIVFGGGNNGIMSVPNDVWVLTNANGLGGVPQWIQLSPTGQVPRLEGFAAGYDQANNVLIVSLGCCYYTNASYTLTNANGLGGAPQWSTLSPSGLLPAIRATWTYGYNASLNRLLVFGGSTSSPNVEYNDLWLLNGANGLGAVPFWSNPIPNGAPGSPPAISSIIGGVYDQIGDRLMVLRNGPDVSSGQGPQVWVLSNATGQGALPSNWTHTWGGPANDTGSAVARDSFGNIYVTGSTNSFGAGGYDVLLQKYAPDGTLLWTRTWGGAGDDQASGLVVDANGNVYLVGGTSSFGGWHKALVLKFDANGNFLWAQTWGGGSYDSAYDIAFDSTGNLAVAAESYSIGRAAALLRFAPDGTFLQNSSYAWKGPATYDSLYTIGVDPQGNIILAGISWDYSVYPNHNSILILKYDASGNLVFSENFNGPGDDEAWAFHGIVTDSAGNIYIGGRHAETCASSNFAQCNFDNLLLKLGPTGNIQWARTWGSPNWDTVLSLSFNPQGNILAAGALNALGSSPQMFVAKFDPQGNPLPSALHSSGTDMFTQPMGLLTDPFGNLVVAGAAANNLGVWTAMAFSVSTPSGSIVPRSISAVQVSIAAAPASGQLSSPTGIFDTGGGGADAFVSTIPVSAFQISGAPAVVLTTHSLNFQSQMVNSTSSAMSVVVTNSGNANLNITSMPEITGVGAGDFAVAGGTACSQGVTVVPGGSCIVNVTFTPSVATTESATLSLFDNASDSPQSVALTGSGTPLVLSLQQSNLGLTGQDGNQGATFAEPVATGTGNYYYQHRDFAIPGRGKPLIFQRTYNTLDSYSGPLGANWTHNYNIFLVPQNNVVTVKWEDGHADAFTWNGSSFTAQPGVYSTLVRNTDGSFAISKKDQTQYTFSSSGVLLAITDRNGNSTQLKYDSAGRLVSVTGASGRSLAFAYDSSNRIIQITDPLSRAAKFSYNANNSLVQTNDAAGGVTNFAYDSNHRITSAILPNGSLLLQNSYDNVGRVVTQTNGRGFIWQFAYDTPSPGITTITDPRGNKTLHAYDASLRIIQITDPLGHTTSYSYDSNNDRTSVTGPNGNATSFAYDARGNLSGVSNPLGNMVQMSYDANNNLAALTNPKGKTSTFGYDSRGNLTSVTDALGHASTMAYDTYGELTSRTDANGNITRFAYNATGDLTKITNPLGQASTLAYDGVGHLLSITDANGHATTATYDALDRLLRTADALGNATQFAYDAVSNLLKTTDPNGHSTSYAYDAANNLTNVTDAKGNITQYGYDPNNNRTSFTNANGKITTYAFDAANRLSSISDPLAFQTSYSYDAAGNVIVVKDANGKTNQFAYDALNRLASIAYSDGTAVRYAYDADGNRTNMTDPHGITAYAYDDLDRLLSVKNPGGQIVSYGYDALGNRTGLTFPDGKTLGYQYDPANRFLQVTDWLSRQTTYGYDPGGNLISIAYPTGAGMSFTYDISSRLTKVTNTAITGTFSTTAYTLDAAGNRIGITANGLTRKYGYDALNQLVSQTVGAQVTTWNYDAVGNRLSQATPSGTTNYLYDAADRLSSAGATTFTYDADGNRISQTNGSVSTTYSYDAANRLASVLGPGVNSTFAYDGDGNRIAQNTALGNYAYVNDTAVALPVVLNEQGPDGNIDFAYGLNLIESASSSFNYFYGYDGLGSVTGLTDGTTGRAVTAYAYDAWGNATSNGSVGLKNKFRFTGEALDPGTGLYFLRARYEDPSTGRFLSRDALMGFFALPTTLNRYLYVRNNPLRYSDATGLSAAEAGGSPSSAQLFGSVLTNGLSPQMLGPATAGVFAGTGLLLNSPGLIVEAPVAGLYAGSFAVGFQTGRIIGSIPAVRTTVSGTLYWGLNEAFGPTKVQEWSSSSNWFTWLGDVGNSIAIKW